MGRVVPTKQNVLKQFQPLNRFGGLKKGQTARLLCIELGPPKPGEPFGPWAEWYHNLQVPEVKEGDTVRRERKWFGNYLCLGREEVDGEPGPLTTLGYDADVCPACKLAPKADDFRPTRRHAMNVIEYAVKPGTHELAKPPSVACKVWVFSERTFSQLSSLVDEYEDLRKFDLMITCEVEQFQNYTMQMGRNAAWLDPKYEGLRELVVETYKEQKLSDEELAAAIATKAAPATLLEKVNETAFALGIGGVSSPTEAAPATAVSSAELANIMGTGAAPDEEASTPSPDREPPAQEGTPSAEDIDAMLEGI